MRVSVSPQHARLYPATPSLLALGSSVALLLFGLDRGFGFTDESYYLAWSYDPARFQASIHPFGLPLSIAYRYIGKSIVLFRLLGLLFLISTGSFLGLALRKFYWNSLGEGRRRRLPIIAALSSLSYYSFWIMTPNYNLLADASGAVILAGTLLWAAHDRNGRAGCRFDHVASIAIGCGGCLAFFAKPTFAAVAALAIAIFLSLGLRRHWATSLIRATLTAVGCGIPLLLTVGTATGLRPFLSAISIGTTVLNYGNSLTQLPVKTAVELARGPIILHINIVCLVICCLWIKNQKPAFLTLKSIKTFVCVILVLDAEEFARHLFIGVGSRAEPWNQMGLPSVCLSCGVLAVGIIRKYKKPDGIVIILPLIILTFMPFTIAFGTANSIITQVGMSQFAVLLSIICSGWLFLPRPYGNMIEHLIVIWVPILMFWSSLVPYGLHHSLYSQQRSIKLPFTTSELKVDNETYTYASGLMNVADKADLDDCTPIVDLSGGGPGTALVMNDRAPFYPWLVHIFDTSGKIADAAWRSMTPQEREAAWIIGPIHPAFADTELNGDLARRRYDYRLVGKLPMVFWGKTETIDIWRPIRQSTEVACSTFMYGKRTGAPHRANRSAI